MDGPKRTGGDLSQELPKRQKSETTPVGVEKTNETATRILLDAEDGATGNGLSDLPEVVQLHVPSEPMDRALSHVSSSCIHSDSESTADRFLEGVASLQQLATDFASLLDRRHPATRVICRRLELGGDCRDQVVG